jgi:hypothetical protein
MSDGPFKLAASDAASTTWGRLEKHLRTRIEDLRTRNEAPLDAVATADLRGRIAELKALLRAAEPDPPPIDLG